jgi:hypothetical protein
MTRAPKALLAIAAASAPLFIAASAKAQSAGLGSTDWRRESRSEVLASTGGSPQYFAAELRFGPYSPNVDSEFNGKAKPYEDTFGTGVRFYFGLEFDFLPLRIPYVGVVGAGFGWGYTKASGKAKYDSGIKKGQASDEDTSLAIMPMYGAIVLRADHLMRRTGIPLVPYAKFGIGFAPWKATDASGTSQYTDPETQQVIDAAATTLGFHLALGGMLSLNFIDPRSAARLDESTGVNHIYLFGEWMDAMLNGIGSGPAMRVGTSTFIGGIAVDI